MAEQYWVGNFFIDLTRNQITQKTQSQTIPPKALAVLTYLAKNANKVVSHDELLSEVWPNTIVTPNTLQRSIAQLRKALGEDNQVQSYIKTHAKQGYSLEVEVRWQDLPDTSSPQEPDTLTRVDAALSMATHEQKDTLLGITNADLSESLSQPPANTSFFNLKFVVAGLTALALLVIFGSIGAQYLTPTQPVKLTFAELRLLTTSDSSEVNGNYTPDGQYIVFNRFADDYCFNHLWAKNVRTQEEFKLTKNQGAFGSHSFAQEGNALVVIEKEGCNKPINQKYCYKLSKLDFQKALETPQPTTVLMECKNSTITNPKWLNNNNIAFLQQLNNRHQLSSYSITDNQSTVIYTLDEGNIYDFDYSSTEDLIALFSKHSDGVKTIKLLKPDGELLSSYPIKYPQEIAKLRNIYPNFMPNSEQLIFSTGRQLFNLSYQGDITNISLPLDEALGSPVFHPEGKRMVMTTGSFDTDIATLPLLQLTNQNPRLASQQTQNETINNYAILQRTIRMETQGLFQPNGHLIAFISRRSGQDQIWISDGVNSTKLTDFPLDTFFDGMAWAKDGKSILVNANRELTQVFLQESMQPVTFEHSVEQLFFWDSESNTALMNISIEGRMAFAEFNLSHSELKIINDNPVKWASKTDAGRIIYTDYMDRFWQSGPAEYQLIEALDNQGSDKRFVVENNVIYGINEALHLWSYDLNQLTFKTLGKAPENLDYLTDINETDILFTIMIEAKKEVAELVLSD